MALQWADHEAPCPHHSVLMSPSPRPYHGAKPHRLTGQADTEVDVTARVPANCWAQLRGLLLGRLSSRIHPGCGWCGTLETRASCLPQILAAALTECHRKSSAQGKPLALKVFVAGRNRLENDGATALAEAFGVSGFCPPCPGAG